MTNNEIKNNLTAEANARIRRKLDPKDFRMRFEFGIQERKGGKK